MCCNVDLCTRVIYTTGESSRGGKFEKLKRRNVGKTDEILAANAKRRPYVRAARRFKTSIFNTLPITYLRGVRCAGIR